MYQKLIDHLQNLGIGALAPVLGTALVLIIGLLLLKLVVKLVSRYFSKSNKLDPSVERLIVTVIRLGGCAVLVLVCAEMLSIPTTSLVTLLGTFGLALSLSLQSTVENIASGIFIMVSKPFHTGHWIVAGDSEGEVIDIGLTHTVLMTATNQRISVPNGKLAGETIVNYSTENRRRLDLRFSVPHSADTKTVKEVMARVVEQDGRYIKDFEPFIRVWEIDKDSVVMMLRIWVKPSDYWETRSALTENVKIAFDENGIKLANNAISLVNEK